MSPSTSSRRAWRCLLTAASASSRLRPWVADRISTRSSSRNSRARCLAWMGQGSGRSLLRCQADTAWHCSASAATPPRWARSSRTSRPNAASRAGAPSGAAAASSFCAVSSTWPKTPIRVSSISRCCSCKSSSLSFAAASVRRMRRNIISTNSSRQRMRVWRNKASSRVCRLPGCTMSSRSPTSSAVASAANWRSLVWVTPSRNWSCSTWPPSHSRRSIHSPTVFGVAGPGACFRRLKPVVAPPGGLVSRASSAAAWSAFRRCATRSYMLPWTSVRSRFTSRSRVLNAGRPVAAASRASTARLMRSAGSLMVSAASSTVSRTRRSAELP